MTTLGYMLECTVLTAFIVATVQTLMKCCILQHFIWVFTVCKSGPYGFPIQKGLKKGLVNLAILSWYKIMDFLNWFVWTVREVLNRFLRKINLLSIFLVYTCTGISLLLFVFNEKMSLELRERCKQDTPGLKEPLRPCWYKVHRIFTMVNVFDYVKNVNKSKNTSLYCKTCVKWPLKNRQNKGLYNKW